ncbi:MAG TPA: MFS transporter [Saprospiraceae bacterium]|nr:MFS transporter [Saprospiraceae bacterium]
MEKKWVHLAAVATIITAGINIITVLPFMVGAANDYLGYNKIQLGWFAAADTSGVMLSGISTYYLGKRFSLRQLILGGLGMQALLHLISLILVHPVPLIGVRFLAGWFGGLAYTAALSYFARLKRPELGYTSYIIVYSIISGLLLMIYPYLLGYSYYFGFGILFVFSVIAFFMAQRAFPVVSEPAYKPDRQVLPGGKVGWVLIAFLFFQCSNSSIYSFSERIGNENGLSPAFLGFSIGFSIFVGLVSGFLVLILARFLSYARQIFLGLVLMFGSLIILYFRPGFPLFYLTGITLLGFGFTIVLPNLFSVLASKDPSGSKVALGTITNWLGQAAGPAISAWYIAGGNFSEIVIPGGIFLIFSMLSMFINAFIAK